VPKQPAARENPVLHRTVRPKAKPRAINKDEPVINIRFKGGVPALVLIPHIIIMFMAMLFSNLAGIMSIARYPQYKKYAFWTLLLLIAGE